VKRMAHDMNARPELAIFGASNWLLRRYGDLSEMLIGLREEGKLKYKDKGVSFFRSFFRRHILPLLGSGGKSLIYVIVAFRPDYFQMSISQLTFLESSLQRIFVGMKGFKSRMKKALLDELFRVRSLFECLEMMSKLVPHNAAPYVRNPLGMKIEVRDLTFAYSKSAPPVLKNVNFTIEPGEIVSIVGYNGSG
jgi:ABC-type multidrug transport system fused ATPase/permease subunit